MISLHLSLERGYEPLEATAAVREALASRRQDFVWLDPPRSLGPIIVLDVRGARDVADHTERVQRRARSVWEAWKPHHETVRAWRKG